MFKWWGDARKCPQLTGTVIAIAKRFCGRSFRDVQGK